MPNVASRTVSALVFDLDDIFYESTISFRWLFQQIRALGVKGDFDSLFSIWKLDYLPAVWSGQIDFWLAIKNCLLDLGLSFGQIHEILLAAKHQFDHYDSRRLALPMVVQTLQQLNLRGIPQAIIGNCTIDSPNLITCLRLMGVPCNFVKVKTSLDAGSQMPRECDLFEVCETFNQPPHQIGFVSANQRPLDVARRNGLVSIGVGPGRGRNDVTIEQFSDLMKHCETNTRLRVAS